MPEKDVNKTKKSSETEIEDGTESEESVLEKSDKDLKEREDSVKTKEETLDRKIKEVSDLQDTIMKEWDEKSAELDALAELTETSDEETEEIEEETESTEAGETEETKIEKTETEKKEVVTENSSPIDEAINRELIEENERNERFRTEVSSRIEELHIKGELTEAREKFPKMSDKEILLEIERDPSQDVLSLAEVSHKSKEADEKKIREDIESQMAKEKEDTETLPTQPSGGETPETKKSSGDPWEEATKRAKDDLGVQE